MDIASSVVEALRSDHTSVKPLLNALGNPFFASHSNHLLFLLLVVLRRGNQSTLRQHVGSLQGVKSGVEFQAGLPVKFKTLGAWRWATATVASRTMYLPDDAAGALMPFGDLHNHRSPPAAASPDLGGGFSTL